MEHDNPPDLSEHETIKGKRNARKSTLDTFIKNYSVKKDDGLLHKIVVVDIETTGLDPISDIILEIGICELNLDTGECLKLFDKVVKEPKFSEDYRDSWIFLNSDLRFETVINAPDLEGFREEIQSILKKYPATAFNKAFDFSFFKNRGFKISFELPCPMMTLTSIMKIPHRSETYRYKYPSVQEAWNYLFPNDYYQETHRAYDDAFHEARIVYEMQRKKLWNLIEKK